MIAVLQFNLNIMKYTLLFCFLLVFQFGKSQEKLTLLDCVNIAIENSLSLEQAEYDVLNTEAAYDQSKLQRLPNLNGSFSSSYNFGRSLDFTSYEFRNQTIQANSFGFNTDLTLFSGGRITENIRLQKLRLERGETNLKSLKDDIAISVANAYLQALTAKEQIGVAEVQVKARELEVERTQKLIDAGVAAGSMKVDMEAQLANAEFVKQQAENAYETAILNLKQVMLLPFNTAIELVEPDIAFPSLSYLQTELNPDKVLQGALSTLGSVELTNQDIAIAESNKKIAKSQRMPTLSFGAGVNSFHSDQSVDIIGQDVVTAQIPVQGLSDPTENAFISSSFPVTLTDENYNIFNQFGDNMSQNVGLSLSIPIFNRGNVQQQIKQADIAIDQAKVNQKLQVQQIDQNIQSAYLQAELAYRSYEASRIQVESLKKAEDFAQKRYDLGTASIYDLFTAQNNLANAEIQLTQSKFDYLYRVKVLEFYKENQFELIK